MLRVALDVGPDERAAWHDAEVPLRRVLEHGGGQPVAEPPAGEGRVDLRVNEDPPSAAVAIVGDAGQLSVDMQLVPSPLPVVVNCDLRLLVPIWIAHVVKTSGTLSAMTAAPFDPYRILGVTRGATDTEIGRAYRRMAKDLHPDLHGADGEAAMQRLNRAFRILSNRESRRHWDATHPSVRHDHWATSVPSPAGSAATADPLPWASWEVESATTRPAGARLRAAEAWPRQAESPTAPEGGLRDSAWLAVGVALAVVLGAVILGWIASSSTVATSGRDAINRVGVTPIGGYMLDPDHEVGVFLRSGDVIGLVVAERTEDGWTARVVREAKTRHPLSVLLFAEPDAEATSLSAIAFGRAEGGVAEVRVRGPVERRASVVQGTWSMPLPGITDVGQVEWEFVLADGTVVRGGGALAPAG